MVNIFYFILTPFLKQRMISYRPYFWWGKEHKEGKKNRTDNAKNELYLRRQGGVGAFAHCDLFSANLPSSGPSDGGGSQVTKKYLNLLTIILEIPLNHSTQNLCLRFTRSWQLTTTSWQQTAAVWSVCFWRQKPPRILISSANPFLGDTIDSIVIRYYF